MKDETIIFKLEEATKKKLKGVADASKRGMSDYMRLLVEYAIEKKLKL